MFAFKLAMQLCRVVAAVVCYGGFLLAAGLLLYGAAQLQFEGLLKEPETRDQSRFRVQIVAIALGVAFCGVFVFQAASVMKGGISGISRSRLRKATFVGLLYLGGGCLFLCFLVFAGSFQAQWEVPGIYYWTAGGLGVMSLALLGSAGFFFDNKQGPTA